MGDLIKRIYAIFRVYALDIVVTKVTPSLSLSPSVSFSRGNMTYKL